MHKQGDRHHVCARYRAAIIDDLIFFFFVPAQKAPTLSTYGECEKACDFFQSCQWSLTCPAVISASSIIQWLSSYWTPLPDGSTNIVTCMECEMSWGNAARKM